MSAKVAGELVRVASGGSLFDGSGIQATAVPTLVLGTAANMAALSWVGRVRAADIAGSDGASITSFSGIESSPRTWSGSGTLKTAGNGINNRNVLRLNGSSNVYTTPTGAASLATDFYAYAVVKFTSIVGYQDVMSFGDATNTERRSMLKFSNSVSPNNCFCFIGELADVRSATALAAATTYLLEMAYNATTGRATLWVNGYQVETNATSVTSSYASLTAYSSTVLRIGQNPSGGEWFNGDIAEAGWLGSFPTSAEQQTIRKYIADYYALSITDSGGLAVSSAGVVAPAAYTVAKDSFVYGGITPLLTGGTNIPIDKGAAHSFYGAVAFRAGSSEHMISCDWTGQNVCAFWNRNASGFSASVYRKPGTAGNEMAAVGVAPVSTFPWGGPNNSLYLETSNFSDTTKYGDYREIQTKFDGANFKLRKRTRDDTNAIEEYDLTAAEPSVNGATTGLVKLNGRPVTSVANNGTLNTNITTGATQCGIVIVKDTTNSRCAVYRLENTTLTAISVDTTYFSTTATTASKVNTYNSSGQLQIENKLGSAANLTAAYYGG
jgi:hypothetical protein